MKYILLLFAAIMFVSCNSSRSEKNEVSSTEEAAADLPVEIIPHQLIDDKKQVMAQMMLPSNWKMHNEPGKAAFTGPNDIFVFHLPTRNFSYSDDPMMQQVYAQKGLPMRRFTSAREVVMQDLVPIAEKEGSRLIRIVDAPEIAKADSRVQDMMYTIGNHNNRYEAVISEWEDKTGKPYAIIVHANGSKVMNTEMWMYSGQILDAPKDHFSSAVKTLANGLASLEYNPRYFDQYNANEMNRESTSWAAHNQRMASNQRNFDAQQAAFKQKSEAVNNSIMASYNERNASSDRIHNRFVNYIKDENTVINRSNGQRYQVQSGSDQYWMNNDGQYIGTNDPNYDPNRNQGTQNQTWTEAEVTD